MDFTIIKTCGLTQKEFAVLCGVSRTTTNLWVTGKMKPHRYIQDRVAAIVAALGLAHSDAQLPIDSCAPHRVRAPYFKLMLHRHGVPNTTQ